MDNLKLRELILHCKNCSLYDRPHVAGTGSLNPDVLLVGEAPGRREAELGIPFVGYAGAQLSLVLSETKFPKNKYYITNAIKCHPVNNETPTKIQIDECHNWLIAEAALFKPKVIVSMGVIATTAVLNLTTCSISQYRGSMFTIDVLVDKIPVFPTYHPAAVLYDSTKKDLFWKDFWNIRQYCKKEIGW